MKKIILLTAAVLFFINSHLMAQSISGEYSFLNFPAPSALVNSYGNAGASLPTTDEFAFFYNPAQLGYFSMNKNAGIQFQPYWVNFVSPLGVDISAKNFALNGGYKFTKAEDFAYSVGIGYIRSAMEISLDNPEGLDLNGDYDYDLYGAGFGFSFKCLNVYLGYTLKSFTGRISEIEDRFDESTSDLGILISYSVDRALRERFDMDPQFEINKFTSVSPVIEVGAGYSIKNLGKSFGLTENDTTQIPYPRMARAGISFTLGINLEHKYVDFEAIRLSWAGEASDYLVENNTFTSEDPEYKGIFGDISFWDNIIEGNANDNITRYRGARYGFFETIEFGVGSFEGGPYPKYTSDGVAVKAKGLFKLLKLVDRNDVFAFLADHIDLRYIKTNISGSANPGIEYEGISLSLSGY